MRTYRSDNVRFRMEELEEEYNPATILDMIDVLEIAESEALLRAQLAVREMLLGFLQPQMVDSLVNVDFVRLYNEQKL